MLKRTVRAIEAHAIAEYPRECCGVVVMDGRKEVYLPCHNAAPEGHQGDYFEIDDREYAEAEKVGRVVAVVHSHPDMPARPSEADRVMCEEMEIPWVVVSVRKGLDGAVYADGIERIQPQGYRAPLVGREFYHGVLDCYAIIRDYYAREMDTALPDFARQDKWWEGDQELYLDNFRAAGFEALPDGEPLCRGDVILMQHYSKRVNHGAVYLDDRYPSGVKGAALRGLMLHHLYGRPSEITIYGGYWRDITRLRLRLAAALR